MNAVAYLWYGVIDKRSRLLKLADDTFGEEIYSKLETLAERFGFDEICLQREGYDPTEDHGVAAWSFHCFDWEDTKPFKMPPQATLDRQWRKIAQKLGIKKKPQWYLWTEYS